MPVADTRQSLELLDRLPIESRGLYEDSLNPVDRAADWREALGESRRMIVSALRASNFLDDVGSALTESGNHMTVFRSLMAPPASQDQFKLICPAWSKSSEKTGRGIAPEQAAIVAESFERWRSRRLAPWLKVRRSPTLRELDSLISATAPLMADQRVATARRNRLAKRQETSLIGLLEQQGWERLASRTIDRQGALGPRQFTHKARFASGATGRAEVDIALGLDRGVVLAMECKVTNDETNSVKRINDILKKANAWREHWGNFVQPAALLEGVIKRAEIEHLVEHNVRVFWTHRLDLLDDWLQAQLK